MTDSFFSKNNMIGEGEEEDPTTTIDAVAPHQGVGPQPQPMCSLKLAKDQRKMKFSAFFNDDDDFKIPSQYETPERKRLCFGDFNDDDADNDNDNDNDNDLSNESQINDRDVSNETVIESFFDNDNDDDHRHRHQGPDKNDRIEIISAFLKKAKKLKHKELNEFKKISKASPVAAVTTATTAKKQQFNAGSERLPLETPKNEGALTANFVMMPFHSDPVEHVSKMITKPYKNKKSKTVSIHFNTNNQKPPEPPANMLARIIAPRQQQQQQQDKDKEKKPHAALPRPDLSGFDSFDDIPKHDKTSATPQLIRATYTPTTPLKCPNTPMRTPSISRCLIPPMTVAHPSKFRKSYGDYFGKNLEFTKDNLKFCEKLGEGSFGVVFKVESIKNNQFYALKISKKTMSFSRQPSVPAFNTSPFWAHSEAQPAAPAKLASKSSSNGDSGLLTIKDVSGGDSILNSSIDSISSSSSSSSSLNDKSGHGGSSHENCHSLHHIFQQNQHMIAHKAKQQLKITLSRPKSARSLIDPPPLSAASLGASNDAGLLSVDPCDTKEGFLRDSPLIRQGQGTECGGGGGGEETEASRKEKEKEKERKKKLSRVGKGRDSENEIQRGGFAFVNREVERMMSIPQHPNIVHIVQAWEEPDRHIYILTELCEGSLKKLLEELWSKDEALSEAQILTFARDMFNGVNHLHTYMTMHFDLKPDNMLLWDKKRHLKIGDFGLAYRVGDKGAPSEGDNKYMAPELLDNEFGYPADIFSLGITLYEMATPKIDLPSNGERWKALRNNDIDFRTWSYSEELKQLIVWMLKADPKERPTAAQLVSHSIFKQKHQKRSTGLIVKKPIPQ